MLRNPPSLPRTNRPLRAAAALTAALCLTLGGCTGHASSDPAGSGPTTGTGHVEATVTSPACPGHYLPPDPDRPRMALHLALSGDHSAVTGTEQIVFRPELPISQLIFRLTANTAPTVSAGTHITITSATADHGARAFTFTRAAAAASTQGGLLHIPFVSTIRAGTVVTAHIAFRLALGGHGFDRFGRSGPFAFLGSGEPLLAWQRGFGWHTEDMTSLGGETATSEAMDVSLAVRAPSADTVIMSGDPADPPTTGARTRTWRAHIPTARDISVAAGPFVTADRKVGAARLRVGAPTRAEARRVITNYAAVMRDLAARFGPYPYASLSVARFSHIGGGIEYPSSILAFNSSRSLAAHETAHQWFYGMVGDSQALHPWLDEAFANYAEALVDGGHAHRPDGPALRDAGRRVDGPVRHRCR